MKAGNSALLKWKTVGGILAVRTSIATTPVRCRQALISEHQQPAKSLSRPVHVISTCRAPGKERCRRASAQENPRTSFVRLFFSFQLPPFGLLRRFSHLFFFNKFPTVCSCAIDSFLSRVPRHLKQMCPQVVIKCQVHILLQVQTNYRNRPTINREESN